MLRSLVLVAAFAVAMTACSFDLSVDTEATTTRSYALDGFDKVDIGSSFDGTVTLGEDFEVEVTVAESRLDDVEVEVDDEVLRVRAGNGSGRLDVLVTLPDLVGITVQDSSSVVVNDVDSERLTLVIDDSSDLELDGAATTLMATIDGSSDTRIDGTFGTARFDVEGSSDLVVTGSIEDVVLSAGGSSDVDLDGVVVGKAEVEAGGSSTVGLKGAEVVTGSIGGSSDLIVAAEASVDVTSSGSSDLRRD